MLYDINNNLLEDRWVLELLGDIDALSLSCGDWYGFRFNISKLHEIIAQHKALGRKIVVVRAMYGYPITTNIDQFELPVLWLSSNFEYANTTLPGIAYWPNWLMLASSFNNPYTDNKKRLLSMACRNFDNNRPGKIYTYEQLKNREYFNTILITKFRFSEELEYNLEEIFKDDLLPILNSFLNDFKSWPIDNNQEGDLELIKSMTEMNLPVYTDSLFHIVCETTIEETLLSEKTFKIFRAGQIPVFASAAGTIVHLRDLGFDMFDDIVDHSYDLIKPWTKRIDAMLRTVDAISRLNLEQVLLQTANRRLHNYRLLAETNWIQKYIQSSKLALEKLL